MANRPVFVSTPDHTPFVKMLTVDFTWNPGLSLQQKQKNILALHAAAAKYLPGDAKPLEISSKSPERLGVMLSAFNLTFFPPQQDKFTALGRLSVECAFQGSKVFGANGPYSDIFHKSSREAKQDARLRSGAQLTAFRFFDEEWPTTPVTAFYDWLYLTALETQNAEIKAAVRNYCAFTDIEFNPNKSLNCQAHSAALWSALSQNGHLAEALSSQAAFLSLYTPERKLSLF
jgi:hypothetical protein